MIEPEIDVPAKRVNGRMWQPGESGNINGRPVGARGRFSQRFIADLADAWEKHGAAALEQTAKLYPDRFVGICLPPDPQRRIGESYSGVAGRSGGERLDADLGGAGCRQARLAGCRCSPTWRGYVLCARRDPGARRQGNRGGGIAAFSLFETAVQRTSE